jgi:dGTPase
MHISSAPYAVDEHNSRGRQFPEKPHKYRTDFERDRDRIIHCAAFRRLEGKTQVFTTGLNDQYRTRMTHSIEVAQIGRTIARVLGLNESLTEAVCLAHDLGHSPFGHTGQDVLNQLMADAGGFEHNRQSLRIVDFLEHPYPDFPGLNLMVETRRALAKHQSPYDNPDGKPESICLEGRIADVADRIAYNCHDLEDGLRSRLWMKNSLRGSHYTKNRCGLYRRIKLMISSFAEPESQKQFWIIWPAMSSKTAKRNYTITKSGILSRSMPARRD